MPLKDPSNKLFRTDGRTSAAEQTFSLATVALRASLAKRVINTVGAKSALEHYKTLNQS